MKSQTEGTVDDREGMIRQLDEVHDAMRTVLAGVDRQAQVYPGWKVQELLAHLAGWSAVTRDALRAHAAGEAPGTPAQGGFKAFNARSVEARRDLSYEQAVADWEQTHDELRRAVADMPAEKLLEKLVFPWGPRGTVTRLVGIMAGHEEEHARELAGLS